MGAVDARDEEDDEGEGEDDEKAADGEAGVEAETQSLSGVREEREVTRQGFASERNVEYVRALCVRASGRTMHIFDCGTADDGECDSDSGSDNDSDGVKSRLQWLVND